MVHDKLASQSTRDKDVEIYLQPKDDKQVDIVVKEIFPCQNGRSEEFYSKSGRWLYENNVIEILIMYTILFNGKYKVHWEN